MKNCTKMNFSRITKAITQTNQLKGKTANPGIFIPRAGLSQDVFEVTTNTKQTPKLINGFIKAKNK